MAIGSDQIFLSTTGLGAGSVLMEDSGGFRASMPLEVGNADVEGVRLAINPGTEVEGRVIIEGNDQTPLAGNMVQFDPGMESRANSPVPAAVEEHNTFSTRLSEGHYDVCMVKGKSSGDQEHSRGER